MKMSLEERLQSLELLGNKIQELTAEQLTQLSQNAGNENPWFTRDSIMQAFAGIANYLQQDKLRQWVSQYDFSQATVHRVIAVVMAGNIPLVGFHDLLAVVLTGNKALVKLSSKDTVLMKWIIQQLQKIDPAFNELIDISSATLRNFDGVIATGSDNTSRHFDYYFRKYPHIIRYNRTSCAVLSGQETEDELRNLGKDVFYYFGLGCRSVSKVYVPAGYKVETLFEHWQDFRFMIDHHKYANNYDYQKAILLVNRDQFLDNGFILLQESTRTVSPIAVVYYEYYNNNRELEQRILKDSTRLQCIVGKSKPASVPFGMAQFPDPWDYADGVDTIRFLLTLN